MCKVRAGGSQSEWWTGNFVDDTIAIFNNRENAITFLNHLNTQSNSIKFTMEGANNQTLPFLDVKLTLSNNSIVTCVYRKPTFTGRTINYKWVVPNNWKINVLQNAIKRAYYLCSDWVNIHQEFHYLSRLFQFNNYPEWIIHKRIKSFLHSVRNQNLSSVVKEKRHYIPLQYYGKASDDFKKRLKRLFTKVNITDICVTFKTMKMHNLFNNKDKTKSALKSLVVYKYSCLRDSNICYVGKTNRHLHTRILEHRKGSSAIFEHLHICDSCANTNNFLSSFKILHQASDKQQLEIIEALYIKKENPKLNSQIFQSGASFLLGLFN